MSADRTSMEQALAQENAQLREALVAEKQERGADKSEIGSLRQTLRRMHGALIECARSAEVAAEKARKSAGAHDVGDELTDEQQASEALAMQAEDFAMALRDALGDASDSEAS